MSIVSTKIATGRYVKQQTEKRNHNFLNILFSYRLLGDGLKSKCTLGDIAKHRRNDADKCIRNGRMHHGKHVCKKLDQAIGKCNKGDSSQRIPE